MDLETICLNRLGSMRVNLYDGTILIIRIIINHLIILIIRRFEDVGRHVISIERAR